MDPKKLLEKIPRFDRDKPFRYLGRRVVQAMAEAATSNLVLGRRTAPGRYMVVRLAESADERDQWEQQYAESKAVLLQELKREAAARDIQLRSDADLDLIVIPEAESARGEAERALSTVMEPEEIPAAYARLQEERELIIPRRVRTLFLESEPAEAQVYLDHKPLGVTPCRVEDVPEGEHVLTYSRPGFLMYEEVFRVEAGRPGQRLVHRAVLTPEPEMGVLEIRTFPPGARVTIGGETRETPTKWRLPAGPVQVRVQMEDFESQELSFEVPPSTEHRPYRVQARLRYSGPERDEVVGRLIVYKPGTYPQRHERETAPANVISAFFRDVDAEPSPPSGDASAAPPHAQPQVLGEQPLRRGVVLIGREDPGSGLQPDIRLFDPENSVSRGCHAWLWVYADRSTGATYNTFLIGNNSPAGIRVDGQLVMETRRLPDDALIEVGNFVMRMVKETPEARVEFGF
jgi:hypothetical protein